MADTSVATLDRAMAELLRRLSDATQKSGWRTGKYRIEDLAQDQVIFEVDRGRGYEVYRGRRAQGGDAQSQQVPLTTAKRDEVRRLHGILKAALITAWDVDEPASEMEPSVDYNLWSFDSEQFDEFKGHLEVTVEWTANRIAHELLNRDARNDWSDLREAILLAEDTDFTPEQSDRLAPRLLELALAHWDSDDPQDEPVVWSAIRTGASMLRPDQADRLRPLLEPGHIIETSVVALKMLGRIFEAQPPHEVDRFPELAKEARGIAECLLNPHAIASAPSAAKAQLAVYALAAMASSGTLEIAEAVRGLNVNWFTQQTRRELRELRGYWDNRTSPVGAGPKKMLEEALERLEAD